MQRSSLRISECNSVLLLKVLMCGDCELGPIGCRNDESNKFWVAVERVSYKESKEDEDEDEDEDTDASAEKVVAKPTKPQVRLGWVRLGWAGQGRAGSGWAEGRLLKC